MRIFKIIPIFIYILFLFYQSSNTYAETTYKLNRLGIGSIEYTSQTKESFEDLRLGWFHNWSNRIFYNDEQVLDPVLITHTDFYGLVGGYSYYACENYYEIDGSIKESMINYISEFPDRSIIWVGNEIGHDDDRDPSTYAHDYKYCYDMIKEINPNIKVTIGGNPGMPSMDHWLQNIENWQIPEDPNDRWSYTDSLTINHFEYLTYVMDDYETEYGESMPFDAVVLHFYPCAIADCNDTQQVITDLETFRSTFMSSSEDSIKPIIVTEFNATPEFDPDWTDEQKDQFYETETLKMTQFYDLLINATGQSGNPYDNDRYVQRISWFNGYSECSDLQNDVCQYSQSFFLCPANSNCEVTQVTSPFGLAYIEYVDDKALSYDTTLPEKPNVKFTFNPTTIDIEFRSTDDNLINTYIVSLGEEKNDASFELWEDIGLTMQQSYSRSSAEGKYFNVLSRDDGYNESPMNSILIIDLDLNSDLSLSLSDYSTFVNDYIENYGSQVDLDSDLDGDGYIKLLDYSIFAREYLIQRTQLRAIED